MRLGALVTSVFVALLVPFWPIGAESQEFRGLNGTGGNRTETLPEGAHEFDFTIGRWNIQQVGGGTATDVVKSFGGVAITEKMRANGFVGNSVTVLDSATGLWTQTYYDNQNTYLQLTGRREGDEVVLVGTMIGADGVAHPSRLRYLDITRNAFDQVIESSDDGGETWSVTVRLQFRKSS